MKLSVIIPAYNEEKRIEKTLEAVCGYLSRQTYDYEIIVVDDGSKDQTATIVNSYLEKELALRLISYADNQGKGYAVRRGMLEANAEMHLFMDADNSTSIEQIEKLLPYIKTHDVVISSRRIAGSHIVARASVIREILSKVFSFIVHTLIPLHVSDTQNGFKLFTHMAAKDIFSRQRINRWAFDVEVLALAEKMKYTIKEVPVDWVSSGHSRMTFKGMIQMLIELVTIRIRL